MCLSKIEWLEAAGFAIFCDYDCMLHWLQCMAEVGRLESCKTEVMRRLITEKWSDVQAVCTASHVDPPALPLLYHDALSGNSSPNSGQVDRKSVV